jgi:hypothetical protein
MWLSWEAANTNSVVFGLTLFGFEPSVYQTQDEHANYYTTEDIL